MTISSGCAHVFIEGPEELTTLLRESSFIENYIPEAKINSLEATCDHKLRLIISDAETPHFEFSPSESVLSGKLGTAINIKDIITVVDHCLEFVRQSKSIFCVHGSAIASEHKQGIIFFGSVSGLGKTTLALDMCLKKNFSFIGDEKILLDSSRQIIGGAKRLSFNKSALQDSVGSDLDNKSLTDLSQKIRIEQEHIQAKLFILPMLFPSSHSLEIDEWDHQKANFHAYEELTRKIRGTSRRIQNFTFPLPSIDSEELAIKRSEFAQSLSENCQFIYLKGGQNEITEFISNLLSRAC